MDTGPTIPTNMIGLISLLIQSIGLLVLVGGAWSLSKQLTTLVLKLEFLASLPVEVANLRLEFTRLKADVDNLWNSYRDFCKTIKEKDEHDWERVEDLLGRLDKQRKGSNDP